MSNPAPSRPLSPTFFPSLAFLLFGVALALGFVTATDKFGRSLTQIRQNRPEIVVKGVATQNLRAAQGMVQVSLRWRGEDFEAGRRALTTQRAALNDVLRELGFTPSSPCLQWPWRWASSTTQRGSACQNGHGSWPACACWA